MDKFCNSAERRNTEHEHSNHKQQREERYNSYSIIPKSLPSPHQKTFSDSHAGVICRFLVRGQYVGTHDGFDFHKPKAELIMIKSGYRTLKNLHINYNGLK
jgi:hypothetical protein